MIDQAPRLAGHPQIESGADWLFGPGRSARVRRILLLILTPAIVLVVTLQFDFVFDDNLVVLGDPLVVQQFDARRIFGSEVRVADVALGYYRPLITLLYLTDRALWGVNPAGYHFSNLLWHLLATVLVYRLARRTIAGVAAALAGGMLFAVLPAHTEAVGWIQGRVDLVSTVFLLLALLALVRARDEHRYQSWLWTTLGGCTFLAALLAKESAIVFPLAWAMWELSAVDKARWRECLPAMITRFAALALALLVYCGLRRWAVGASFSYFSTSLSPVPLRTLALPLVLAEYGRVLLFPDLTLNFFRTVRVALSPTALAIGLVVVVVLGGGLLAVWRRARRLFPWAAWVPIMLVPPLFFILQAQAPAIGFFIAERFLYLPSVGWCILLGYVLAAALEGRKRAAWSPWGMAAFGGVILLYAGLTLIRLRPWVDAPELYTAIQAQTNVPTAVRVLAHNNLGEVLLERGDFSASWREFQAARGLDPDYAFAYNNLGVLLIREGRPTEALRWIETAIRLDPAYSEAYGNLGAAYEAIGDLPAAKQAYERGLRINPGSAFLAGGLARQRATSPVPPSETPR